MFPAVVCSKTLVGDVAGAYWIITARVNSDTDNYYRYYAYRNPQVSFLTCSLILYGLYWESCQSSATTFNIRISQIFLTCLLVGGRRRFRGKLFRSGDPLPLYQALKFNMVILLFCDNTYLPLYRVYA